MLAAGARAEPQRVVIVLAPAGNEATRAGERVLELLEPLEVQTELVQAQSMQGHVPAREPIAQGTLAHIGIDLSPSTHVVVQVQSARGEQLVRELLRAGSALDEAGREELASVVASSVEALLAGRPLSQLAPAPIASEPTLLSAVSAVSSAQPGPPVARARPVTRSAPREPAPSLPRAKAHALLGYELGLWGEGEWLHGPRLALGYGVPSTWGRLGVRAEGFLAWPSRIESARLDADVSVTALRVLALFEHRLTQPLALEAGLGLSAQLTSIEAAPETELEPLASRTSMGWALRLHVGAVARASSFMFSVGAGLELDPADVQYGVQYSDGFVPTQSPARLRPSLQLNAGAEL